MFVCIILCLNYRSTFRIISVVQKRRLITYPAIPKLDKNMLLASALPPRSLSEKQNQPQFMAMKRSGRSLRTLYGASVKVYLGEIEIPASEAFI